MMKTNMMIIIMIMYVMINILVVVSLV